MKRILVIGSSGVGKSTVTKQIGLLLNIHPNHQDWHADMEEYARAKRVRNATTVLLLAMFSLFVFYNLLFANGSERPKKLSPKRQEVIDAPQRIQFARGGFFYTSLAKLTGHLALVMVV